MIIARFSALAAHRITTTPQCDHTGDLRTIVKIGCITPQQVIMADPTMITAEVLKSEAGMQKASEQEDLIDHPLP